MPRNLAIDDIRYEPPSPRLAWLETAGLTLLIPVIGLLFHRADPMFVQGPFPWLILAPLAVGMRYGFLQGFVSGIATVLLLAAGWRFSAVHTLHDFPVEYALAALITGAIAGEFADGWLRRLGRMQILLDYRSSRQSEFTRSYHLLKVSHDQLEERLAGRQYSLRNALMDLRSSLVASDQRSLLEHNALRILEFLEIHGDLHQAALYPVDEQGRMQTGALARIGGTMPTVIPSHPMIVAALDSGRIVSVREQSFRQAEAHEQDDILAVIPLIDIDGRIRALVIATEMPFLSYNGDNLDLLGALGGSIGDFLATGVQRLEYAGREDDAAFVSRLQRWSVYADRYQLPSNIAAFDFAAGLSSLHGGLGLENLLFEQLRGLDEPLLVPGAASDTVLILMPLSDDQGAEGYRRRMFAQFAERLERELQPSDVSFTFVPVLPGRDPNTVVADLLTEARNARA
ncbi:PelD GGDEF domain-containing protein [Solimonas marina]|uniref:PelD GGDEF domain-containing protein n=1 Tax=Solimonas marina TaxID=2714601 RepID=A0A970B7Z7_9GAMM|nr:PelD GGDEF domain-containing protein [Solimonas marina]NKF20916.1 hypothetical protein [Solimonas marina]